MATTKSPLIVVVGPTASGKTALAIQLALKYDGEIICADSRTVYKEMDIGTAKPSLEERQVVPHHLIDIVSPDQPFSVAEFKERAVAIIADIRARGKVPLLVGGSGLYIDSVIFDYKFDTPPRDDLRGRFQNYSVAELQDYCLKNNIELPENKKNKRYLIRAIEQKGVNRRKRDQLIEYCFVVGIATEVEVLKQRITARAHELFRQGMLDEALVLGKKYGWDNEAMTGNIYRIAHKYQRGEISRQEAEAMFIRSDMRLAKKQRTWFRRNPFIYWDDAEGIVKFLQRTIFGG